VGLLSSAMFVSSESAAWAQEHLAHAATANPPPPLDSLQLNQVASVAEFEGFWANAARYVTFFISTIVGTLYFAIKPLIRLFLKNPLGAMLVIGLVYGVVVGTKGALEVMLGLADSPF